MNKVWGSSVFAVALVAWATAISGASAPKEESPKAAISTQPKTLEITTPRRGVQQLWDLDLRRWPEDRFYENLTAHIDTLSSSHGPETAMILMDTAELYLGQMMMYEAGSVLDAITPTGDAQQRRFQALQDARNLLSGVAVEDFEASALADSKRPDRAFWAAMQGIADADAALLTNNLEAGLLGLIYQTRPVARVVLPLLTEAMIEVGNHAVAAQSLRLLQDFPELSEGSAGHYLRGRAAEVRKNDSTALESYFEAAKGWDRYAVRGRLALAEMALEDGGRGALLAAQDVLEFGADSWRGDRLELIALQKLALVYESNRESIGALKTNGKIMMRFPNSEAATKAQALASRELEDVYAKGVRGELPLSRWLTVHYQLVPAFRYYAEFPSYVEKMGDYMLSIGGTTLAVREYQRALELQRDLAIFNPATKDPQAEFTVTLKLAEAFAKGGQLQESRDLLLALEAPDDPEVRDQVNRLKADVMARLGDSKGLLSTHVKSPGPGNLRDIGKALWHEQEWGQSAIFYSRLWAEFPGQFDVDDATYLLIASHRSGDMVTSQKVVGAFPGLTESQDWLRIAQSFLTQPADVFPLTRNGADQRIESLDQSLDRLSGQGL
ncbi:MAG: tetratricopeptide repeat protein [Cognatishimia sp.]